MKKEVNEMTENERMDAVFSTLRSGVYIVTSAYRNKPAGCTCVWVTRVSFSPPMLTVYLAPSRHTYQAVKAGKRLCVNVMGVESLELARRFGLTSGHDVRKFDGVAFRKSTGGSPIIETAISYLDCKVKHILPVGDHHMVLAEIIGAAIQSNEPPLVYDPKTFYSDETERRQVSQAG